MNQGKIRVAVLFGGRSAEHEVSLRSAENVIQYLDSERFDVIPVGIDKQGKWLLGDNVFANSLKQNQVYSLPHSQQAWFTPEWLNKLASQQSTKLVPCQQTGKLFDVVFPAVHGSYCEDGTLQGLLELAGIPYVGCGVLGSSVGMDKDVSKRLAMHAGINVAPFITIKHKKWLKQKDHFLNNIIKQIQLPVFVKPANTGSSVGISKVKTLNALTDAIEDAFQYDNKVLVEKALTVQEIELAVLESLEPDGDPIISIPGEVKSSHEFYSYDAKYVDDNGADLIIPANISAEVKDKAKEMASHIFQVLECEGMARVDLFYDLDINELYFNEINTLPGFTKISMYPKLMSESGMSYKELLTHLVQLALNRHDVKSNIIRSYE